MVFHQGLAGVGFGLGQLELGVQEIGDRASVGHVALVRHVVAFLGGIDALAGDGDHLLLPQSAGL